VNVETGERIERLRSAFVSQTISRNGSESQKVNAETQERIESFSFPLVLDDLGIIPGSSAEGSAMHTDNSQSCVATNGQFT
jgi:hypothetical protein